jgi:hypothetical protein
MRLLIAFLMTLSLSTFAASGNDNIIDLGTGSSVESIIDIDQYSQNSLKIQFIQTYKTRHCEKSLTGIQNNRLVSYGCVYYSYEDHKRKRSILLDVKKSSAKVHDASQRLEIKINNKHRYGGKLDIKVSITDGPQDHIEISNRLAGLLGKKITLETTTEEASIFDGENDKTQEEAKEQSRNSASASEN